MGKIHGKNTYFAIQVPGTATLTDISEALNSVDKDADRDAAQSTGFRPRGDAHTYVAGLKDNTISVSGMWEGDADEIDEILAALADSDDPMSWEYGPEGNESGNTRYSGGELGGDGATAEGEGVILTSYSISSPLEDVSAVDAEFQMSGPPHRGSFA